MTRMLRLPMLLLGMLVTALVPSAAAAQELDVVVRQVAAAWARADVAAIVGLAARGGVAIDIDGQPGGPLPPRQAAAVLRRLFDERESVRAAPRMARVAAGDPARAFGELAWATRLRGTTIEETTTVFVGYAQENGSWRITQIRLMR